MLYVILISTIAFVHATNFTDPVNTTQGLLRGVYTTDGDYLMYLGVPYAKVDEANPFGVAVPYPHFNGTFIADEDANVCPQQEEFNHTIVGTLDCLNLNIYVPNQSSRNMTLPVLVYLYGGKFMFGFSKRYLYGPKFLVKHDIILVVINYRVGPYGFMCLDIEDVPGNQGLKDQYLALKWIYANIQSFGGDVNRITLAGNSAGAMAVDFHLQNDRPKYYNQAILQSGTGLIPSILRAQNNTVPFQIAQHLGYTTNDIRAAISFLTNSHSNLVVAATFELGIVLQPCIEKEFDNIDRFIDKHPEHKTLTNINNIKIIAGYNSNEQESYDIVETMFPDIIMDGFNIEDMDSMIDTVRKFYIGDKIINQTELYPDLIAFASDFKYNYPIQRNVERYVKNGLKVFQYMFSYSGGRNYAKRRSNSTAKGAKHADELGYLFNIELFTETPTTVDQQIIDIMTTLWANFVKFGNPTPTTTNLIPVTWVPATPDVISYLNINSELVMGSRPFHARLSFWDLFYAANQDYLLANINYGVPSSASPFSMSLLLISMCAMATYSSQV